MFKMQRILSEMCLANLPLVVAMTVPIFLFCRNYFRAPRTDCNFDRVVVITGCDSGVGLQFAKWAREWNYYVLACCLDLSSTGANRLRSLSVAVMNLDVCNKDLVEKLAGEMARLQAEGKVIWCVVNNAGVMTYARTEWLTWDLIDSQVAINLSGTIHVTRASLPYIRHSKGRLINISSPQGLISSPFMTVYCASKWGVEAFSSALRREVSAYGVSVIILRPCNFPQKTQILKRNSQHLARMKSVMAEECVEEFGEEMEALRSTFEAAFTKCDPVEDIDDRHLKRCFRSAIDARCPSRSYTAAPWIVRSLLGILQVLPEAMIDQLVYWDIHTAIINLGRLT